MQRQKKGKNPKQKRYQSLLRVQSDSFWKKGAKYFQSKRWLLWHLLWVLPGSDVGRTTFTRLDWSYSPSFDYNWIAGEPCVRCLYCECVWIWCVLAHLWTSTIRAAPLCSSTYCMWGCFRVAFTGLRLLFASVHPLDVFLVVWFQLFALEFEGVGDQASLRCPGLGAQADLLGDFKSLQFCWKGQNGKVRSGSLVREGQKSYLR